MHDNKILQQSLEKELALLEELNSLSLLKKDAVIKDDLDTLEVIVLKEEALSTKLKTVNDACLPQVQFFLSGQTENTEAVSKIRDLTVKIRDKASQLHRNNQLNQALIRDAMGITQFMINSLMPPEDSAQSGVYGASGKVQRKLKHNLVLDTRG